MSTGAGIAVQGGRGTYGGHSALPHSQLSRAEHAERPVARLLTFAALALYGVLRWSTLLKPVPTWRLLGLLALAVALAATGAKLDAHRRALAVAAAICSLIAVLLISGIPAGWLLHLRIGLTYQGIEEGISSLPGVLVPYIGINPWIRIVIVLGAGVLLLDAALLIAFAPRTLGDLRRIGAALPLIALAVVPSTLARPQLPYIQGLILFALIAAFMWSERTAPHRAAGAIAVAGIAGLGAVILAPGLDQHRPWVNYEAIATSLGPKNVESFDWSQSYGPLNWPQHGRLVLDVKAAYPDYWKTENLDVFNGTAWAQGSGPTGSQLPSPAAAAVRRWTQTLQVTIRAMTTTDVIVAGSASQPADISDGVVPGISAGTWTAGAPLDPGDSYTVKAYSPRPSAAALAAIPAQSFSRYPAGEFADELTIELPSNGLTLGNPPEVQFAQFHSSAQVQSVLGPGNESGLQLVEGSAYGRAFALATRLARAASTPYAFVRSVENYLSSANGFTYDQNPALAPYPLESFLFDTKRGYCQQFAGAMALLLRMGGVPARVVTGFTTGQFNPSTKEYAVSDLDAHAWVEVWFPYYGWVRFDPTPQTAAAGTGAPPALGAQGSTKSSTPTAVPGRHGSASAGRASRGAARHSSPWVLIALGSIVLLLGVCALLAAVLRRAPPTAEQLIAELERALARSGRPLAPDTTLAGLEHRFRAAPQAAAYVRALRLARFAGSAQPPSSAQRRALRVHLRAGLGAGGRLQAVWALPPRFHSPRGPLH